MRPPLNLARQPFRNERLPTLLLGLRRRSRSSSRPPATRASPGSSCPAARATSRSSSRRSRRRRSACSAEAASLRELAAPEGTIAEWAAVKTLVDRRAFSWTGLFAALEQALPPGVRLVSIQPVGRRLRADARGAGAQQRGRARAAAVAAGARRLRERLPERLDRRARGRRHLVQRELRAAGGSQAMSRPLLARGRCCLRSWCCWPSTWACSLAWTLPRSLRQKSAAAAGRGRARRARARAGARAGPARAGGRDPREPRRPRALLRDARRQREAGPAARRSRRSRSWPGRPGCTPTSRALRRENVDKAPARAGGADAAARGLLRASSSASCAGSSARSAS